ncbi:hypothetical protein [Acinetobacter baumannii]|uniref:hypothetical protein n=1 Tax=Acinetobacter baumannii TaxID=470 RepID=UPI002A764A7D|nr:hypothetical protein [Acinetobacter baumannii]WPQ53704.1 hypothetical protein SLQ83_05930 [Acinetobacter baumannii]
MNKCREEFERHYLSLGFHTKGSAQICLDACTFDNKQDVYLPNMDWILENDEDECVTYCCMLNTAYLSFKHQQAKVEEANAKAQMCRDEKNHAINRWSAVCKERDELQKRVDQQGLIIAKAMSIASDLQKSWSMFEIGKKLEQALKGEGQ